MYSKETIIKNPSGLHARPASEFVQKAKEFKSKINIQHTGDDSQIGNAKSMIKLLALCFSQGDSITISAEGDDETAAVDALVSIVESGFGEIG